MSFWLDPKERKDQGLRKLPKFYTDCEVKELTLASPQFFLNLHFPLKLTKASDRPQSGLECLTF